jgi:hypothetical protein
MSEREDPIQRTIAGYLRYLEIGGPKPDLNELDPEARRSVAELIGLLDFTDGVALGMGRSDEQTETDLVRRSRRMRQAAVPKDSDLSVSLLSELESSLPAAARVAADVECWSSAPPGLPIVNGWTVGTFGGRVRVWLVDQPDVRLLDSDVNLLHDLDRTFHALPSTAAIALVARDLSCLVLEPSDCAPAIEAPTGALVPRRHRRPIDRVGDAIASFIRELIPPWEPVPEFEEQELVPLDISELAASCASNAVRSQQVAGARARAPRKDVLSALGQAEINRLAEMTKDLHEGRTEPEAIITQLRELSEVQ